MPTILIIHLIQICCQKPKDTVLVIINIQNDKQF
jgi:hypothetical protein